MKNRQYGESEYDALDRKYHEQKDRELEESPREALCIYDKLSDATRKSWALDMAEAYQAGLEDGRDGLEPAPINDFIRAYFQGWVHGAHESDKVKDVCGKCGRLGDCNPCRPGEYEGRIL